MSGLGFSNSGVPVSGGMPYDQKLAEQRSEAYQTLWDLEERRDDIMMNLEFWTSYEDDIHADSALKNLKEAFILNDTGYWLDHLDEIDDQIEAVDKSIKHLNKGTPVVGSVPPTGLNCG